MTLLRAAGIRVTFGSRTLLDDLTFTIEEGERVGLVGVNGSGKSTMMKVLAGALVPDRGELQLQRGATVTYLPQEPVFPEGATVASELSVARGTQREALEAHAALSALLGTAPPEQHDRLLTELGALSDRIDQLGGWDPTHEAHSLLDRLGVPEWEQPLAQLSGGTRKRVAVAGALLSGSSLLMLDEPTNHLDADTVEWLEEALDALPSALLLVTHDRYFLDDLVDRMVELQPGGGVISYPGNYQAYLEQKMEAQATAAQQRHKRDRYIAAEVAWLRKGAEARRTKSKSRMAVAQKLLVERAPGPQRVAGLQVAAAGRLGEVVFELEKASVSFGPRKVLDRVDVQLRRGERLGIVGRNGAGKTTLLRLLLGMQPPDAGTVTAARTAKVAYYDQGRDTLDPEMTVFEAAGGEESVELGGKRVRLESYLDDLLFPVPMQRMKVKALSGGERNRLLLAKLFLGGANVLVLDEPTNDLDIVTLNVLEELLLGFGGAVLLVTHDRYFLDKVATSILALEGDGKVTRWPGNFSTYRTLKAQGEAAKATVAAAPVVVPVAAAPAPAQKAAAAKLSYKEQRELEGMEAAIEAAEANKAAAERALADPVAYAGGQAQVSKLVSELDAAGAAVEKLYARWQQLQEKAGIS